MIETVRFWLAAGLLVAAGCYRPPSFERCAVQCSGAEACPEGSACLGDGFCHAGGDQVADCDVAPPIDAGLDGGGGESGSAIAVGAEHSCAILGDGRIACWGRNHRGQLGVPGEVRRATPTIIAGGPWSALAAGGAHSCAVAAADGTVWCWGANSLGQGGHGGAIDQLAPAPADTLVTGWSAITAGYVHTCAIDEGALWCWGGNGYDQLGLGNDDDPVLEPAQVAEVGWEVVSAGYFHTCGIRDAGRLYCWGANPDGRLGVGDADPRDVPAEVDPGGMRWRTVSAAGSHSCGIRTDGSLWCWGYSGSGQAGGPSSNVPAMVDPGPWRDVAAGNTHSCGVTEDDELWCWGEDSRGQRGDGLGGGGGDLVEIGTDQTWQGLARGVGDHACARTTAGALHCWGESGEGQIGDGELVDEYAPQQVPGGAGWTAVAAGGDRTCGIRAGALYCWGGHFVRQAEIATTPTALPGAGTGWLAVAVGAQHGCAIDGERNLWCWGDGTSGELGDGGTAYLANPVEIEATREWLDVAVGQDHSCAVEQLTAGASAGPVWCWGANFDAQIRDPVMSGSSVPVETLAPADFDEVSAGQSHTCAHRNGDNEVHCWGSNTHLQTSGGLNPQWPVVPVPNAGWTTVGVGQTHSCGVLVDDIWCWGDDDAHQLGRGDAGGGADSATPVRATSSGDFDGVAGGRDHTCAVARAAPAPGDLWCWGANEQGQLGITRVDGAVDATEIGVGTDWRSVAAGAAHTCAIDGGGSLWCWGDDVLGQLGDGQSNRFAPAAVAPAVEP